MQIHEIDRAETPLLILSASAGSGKTHNLVLEFLVILLADKHITRKFKHIVAMTFTNKAAFEMKSRLISTLDKIVNLKEDDKKTIQMMEDVKKQLDISVSEIRNRSAKALNEMLHGYEDFNVSTIDKFNLKLIRSFSRDLDLPGDFEVSLDENLLIEQVVDTLISKLGEEQEQRLTELMKRYAKANLDEGNSWNFRKNLIEFSQSIVKEGNQPFIERLMEQSFEQKDYDLLKKEIDEISNTINAHLEKISAHILAEPLNPEELSGGKNAVKWLMGRLEKDKWKSNKELFTDAVLKNCNLNEKKHFPEDLANLILSANNYGERNFMRYKVLEKLTKNFFDMALLKFVAEQLSELRENEQLIRISEFNKLINKLVSGEEAPYIYERMGTRLEHFLLDEFQDTSRLQWLNMVPLVHESLSYGRRNLIVGDPKQSIYRFNNGLAEQFVALPAIYNPENEPKLAERSAYFQNAGYKHTLEKNFRSAFEIVDLNNRLFSEWKELEGEMSAPKDFYADVKQEIDSSEKGYVNITSFPDNYELENILPRILEIIYEASNKDGSAFDRGDICILVERNAQGTALANALHEEGIKVVSQESLLICQDEKVKLMIAYLHYRANPNSKIWPKRFAERYIRLDKTKSLNDYLELFQERENPDGSKTRFFNAQNFITTYFSSEETFFAPFENLYDLGQKFIRMMEWEETKTPRLHHFMDVMFDYQSNKHADLRHFLEFLEEKQDKLALQMPESKDAVQIMTVHKSKGLEFPIVIMPYMNYDSSIRSLNRYFVDVEGQIIYTSLSKESNITSIQEKAKEEGRATFLDKLNLMYVALTRPEVRLYGFNNGKAGFGQVLHELLEKIGATKNGETLIFESGEELAKVEKQKKVEVSWGYFEPENVADFLWYPDIVFRSKAKQTSENPQPQREFGNLFHAFMEHCNSPQEIETALKAVEKQIGGNLDNIEKLRAAGLRFFEALKEMNILDSVKSFISEELILVDDENSKRPDKILIGENQIWVVDFKTGKPMKSHQKQMNIYELVLEELYDMKVESLLFYAQTGELVGW